jgi:2-methylcitrate dehydratase PrpD
MTDSAIGPRLGELCDWVVAQRWEDIPDRVHRRARWVLADDLAAMVAGAAEPQVDAYRKLVVRRGGKLEASMIGPGLPRSDRWQAASVNAVAASWCELDEGFRTITCHAGLYVIPAMLAEVEAESLRLADALRALVLAYECVTRVASAFSFSPPTVHAHALWSAIGAAAATAITRRYDAATLKGAITAATTVTSVGPRPHLVEGVLARNVWAAAGAVAGMQCADWSSCGITGSDSSASAVYRDILHAREDAAALTSALGSRWSIESGYHKLYACCQHGHSAVEAVLDLLASRSVDLQRIVGIDAYTHPLALGLANATPTTSLGAKFSMPHMIAAPLVHGSAGADAFSQRSLSDEDIARLRRLVRLRPYEGALIAPFDRPAKIVLTMAGGEQLVSVCKSARGGPDRPLEDDVLLEKIRQLSEPVLPSLPTLISASADASMDGLPWRDVLTHLAARRERSSEHSVDEANAV